METPKIRQLSRLVVIKNNSFSESPIRNKLTDKRRFMKCASDRKTTKNSPLPPKILQDSSYRSLKLVQSWNNPIIKTPQVRRTLRFDNLSPVTTKNNKVFKEVCEVFTNRLSPKTNFRKEFEVIPSVDTPERKEILQNGIVNAQNMWSVIGRGHFGTIVKARYKGNIVAAKVIKKHKKMNCDALLKETNGIHLNHPNIIKTIKVVNNEGINYGLVIMELWDTMDMQYLIDLFKPSISFEMKLRCIMNIGEALQYCHDRCVIHLDVKPKNILIRFYGSNPFCKICDFGNSFLIDKNNHKNYSRITEHQGTIKYMAPELLCGLDITEKADIFSLGITMWQLLHEETPYSGEALDSIAFKVVSQNYRPKMFDTDAVNERLYVELYKICWHPIPEVRPAIKSVALKLKEILENVFFMK